MKIIWSPAAADDLDEAVTYLLERNPDAGRSLGVAVFTLVERLAAEPIDGPIVR